MRNGSCKYGANCRFNHPDPTAAGGTDPPSGFGNGGTAALQSSPQSSVAPWSSPRGLSEAAPFMPIMFPPTQGVPSQSPEWNGYQVSYNPLCCSVPLFCCLKLILIGPHLFSILLILEFIL